jgi:riboflavin synthase
MCYVKFVGRGALMFTGIIDHCGTIILIEEYRVWIKSIFTDLVLGESIAVDGICLTVTQFQDNTFCCDISPETLRITTAKDFKMGRLVNLERALQPLSRIGGHFVMGHVDQMCQVIVCERKNEFVEMSFMALNESARQLVVKKGSITINGVSLTINEVFASPTSSEYGFKVMLIPHTLERTNLTLLGEGDAVNIEFDMMARIIVEQYQRYGSNVDEKIVK